jgi:hypothetical protein
MKSSWVISHVNAVFVSNISKKLSIIRDWCDEWSVHTLYIYIHTHKTVVHPSPYCIGKSGRCLIITDVLPQHRSCGRWLINHLNSCCLLLGLPYNGLSSSFTCFIMFMARYHELSFPMCSGLGQRTALCVNITCKHSSHHIYPWWQVITSTPDDRDNQKYWTWTPHWHSWLPEKTSL